MPIGFWLQIDINWGYKYCKIHSFLSRGVGAVGAQSLPRPGIEPGSPEDQVYNNEIAKNVASNPKGLDFFLTANFNGL